MNNTQLVLTLSATLSLAPSLALNAEPNWKTLADFECRPPASVNALAKDAKGNLYAAVSTSDTDGRTHAQIRKSSDQGLTWQIVDDLTAGNLGSVNFYSLGADPGGHLYAAGFFADEEGRSRWLVRKSGANGETWTTVDDFALPGSQRAVAQALTVDAQGHLFVVGFGDGSPVSDQSHQPAHWLVRHSRDGGNTWSTVDDFNHQFSARAAAILSTSNGLFVAGSGWNGSNDACEQWLVRKGTADDHGVFRWQTVDEFQLQKLGRGFVSQVNGLGLDAHGNLYAVGRSYAPADGGNSAHWVVRRSSNAGTDWTVVDTFQLEAGRFAAASGVASSGRHGVYVVGRATERVGSHWIVRHSATGETGSWSLSDDFSHTAAMVALLQGADQFKEVADGSLVSLPGDFSCGQAILGGSASVLAGGSVNGASNHALVRQLMLDDRGELANASQRQ